MTTEYLDPTDGTTIIEALRGDYGPQAQAEAAELAEVEFEDEVEYEDADPDQEYEEAWAKEASNQVLKLEQELGRPLSMREVNALVDDHGDSAMVPDFAESYDAVIGRSMRNKDDRVAAATEVYEEHEAEQEPEYSSEHSLVREEA